MAQRLTRVLVVIAPLLAVGAACFFLGGGSCSCEQLKSCKGQPLQCHPSSLHVSMADCVLHTRTHVCRVVLLLLQCAAFAAARLLWARQRPTKEVN